MALVCLALAVTALGQSAEESAAQAAERAGKFQEALGHYAAALKKAASANKASFYDAEYQRLGEGAMRAAGRLSRRPPVPEAARNHMVRGRTAFRIAKNAQDLAEARKEFFAAIAAAPWLAEAYYNLASTLEKSERPADAIVNYKIYLSSAPPEKDAAPVRDKIVELQYLQERAQNQRRQDEAARPGKLEAAVWSVKDCHAGRCDELPTARPVRLLVSSSEIAGGWDYYNRSGFNFEAALHGTTFRGDGNSISCCPRRPMRVTVEGEISPDESHIMIRSFWEGRLWGTLRLERTQ